MSLDPTDYPLVADEQTLREIASRLSGQPVLAIDTEFVRERTYHPELCVLQVATDDFVAAIDCLAPVDLEPLFAALYAETRAWLLHSSRQDLEVLEHRAGRQPRRLIDTQLASALIGMPLQVGLQTMLAEILNVSIGKEHTRADWSLRPLPEAVLRYALDDVRYLPAAARALEERLAAAGRLDWFVEDCARLLATPIFPDPAAILERTKGAGGLKGKQRSAAIALVAWRESRARERNRPRRWILADEPLVRIAFELPKTRSALERIPELPPRLLANAAEAILAAIEHAGPPVEISDEGPPDKERVRALQAAIRDRATELGILPELLATRRDIALVVSGQLPEALAKGWRSVVLGDLVGPLSRDR